MNMRTVLKRAGWLLLALILAAAAIFGAGVLWPEVRVDALRTTEPVAILEVTVVDVRGGTTIPRQTVLIEGGTIRAVAEHTAESLPKTARVVDGRGRFLMPSLWDMHAHV